MTEMQPMDVGQAAEILRKEMDAVASAERLTVQTTRNASIGLPSSRPYSLT